MELFSNRFMTEFARQAQRVATETDANDRELQTAALTANGLARLATSERLDEKQRKEAALVVACLVTRYSLDLNQLGSAEEDR
jgi:hypothetical protein